MPPAAPETLRVTDPLPEPDVDPGPVTEIVTAPPPVTVRLRVAAPSQEIAFDRRIVGAGGCVVAGGCVTGGCVGRVTGGDVGGTVTGGWVGAGGAVVVVVVVVEVGRSVVVEVVDPVVEAGSGALDDVAGGGSATSLRPDVPKGPVARTATRATTARNPARAAGRAR